MACPDSFIISTPPHQTSPFSPSINHFAEITCKGRSLLWYYHSVASLRDIDLEPHLISRHDLPFSGFGLVDPAPGHGYVLESQHATIGTSVPANHASPKFCTLEPVVHHDRPRHSVVPGQWSPGAFCCSTSTQRLDTPPPDRKSVV